MVNERAGSEPAEFLVENLHLLPRGRVLDVAMGSGRNAVFMAKQGFVVEGVDISAEAVARAREAARIAGVQIAAVVADLEAGYRIAPNAYDVIMVFNYLQRSLVPSLRAGVRVGGMVIYETFTVEQARFGKPQNPDFLLRPNELLDLFRGFRCLRYREGLLEGPRAVASILAERIE